MMYMPTLQRAGTSRRSVGCSAGDGAAGHVTVGSGLTSTAALRRRASRWAALFASRPPREQRSPEKTRRSLWLQTSYCGRGPASIEGDAEGDEDLLQGAPEGWCHELLRPVLKVN